MKNPIHMSLPLLTFKTVLAFAFFFMGALCLAQPPIPVLTNIGPYQQNRSVEIDWNTDTTGASAYWYVYVNGVATYTPTTQNVIPYSTGPKVGQSYFMAQNFPSTWPESVTVVAYTNNGVSSTSSSNVLTISSNAPTGGWAYAVTAPGSIPGDGSISAVAGTFVVSSTPKFFSLTGTTGISAEGVVAIVGSGGDIPTYAIGYPGLTPTAFLNISPTTTTYKIGPLAPNAGVWFDAAGAGTINFNITQ
jgi:hypothetical protein